VAQRAQQGDREAFEEIVRRYDKRIHAFARSLVGNPDLAEEVLQDTFVRAWRSLASFDSRRRLAPWLLKITANCCRDRWQESTHQSLEEAEAEPEAQTLSPLEYSVERERQEAVAEAINSLPATLRQTLFLFYLNDLTYAEVAEILEVTPKAVGKRLHRARQLLRARLRQKDTE
jgi:RNA polymerase sigma-70 factor (ECF subfamily)